MKTPSSLVTDLQTSISNSYYYRKIHKEGSVKSPTTEIISPFPCTSQPRSLHVVHLHKPELLFLSSLGYWVNQWGLNGIFCIIYSILIMACNTYMYILYYLLYAGIGFCSLNTGLKIATHWSPMRPKIEHWRLNFQNWSPAGDSRFVR